MKNGILISMFLIFSFNTFSQNEEKNYDEAYKLIAVWLEAQKDFERLPGISAVIVKDQDILWSGAFGKSNIEGNIDSKAATLCSICSISKLFTSVAIMKFINDIDFITKDGNILLLAIDKVLENNGVRGKVDLENISIDKNGILIEAKGKSSYDYRIDLQDLAEVIPRELEKVKSQIAKTKKEKETISSLIQSLEDDILVHQPSDVNPTSRVAIVIRSFELERDKLKT